MVSLSGILSVKKEQLAARHRAEPFGAAQIMVAQHVESVALLAHPELGQRLGIGERAAEQA